MYRFHQLFLCYFLVLSFNRNCAETSELYSRLNALVNYVIENEESQMPDLMLGAYLCEAQLMAIGNEVNKTVPSLETIVLQKVHKLCETYQKKQVSTWSSTSPSVIVSRHLLSSRFWSATAKNDDFIYGNLTSMYPITISLENFASRIDYGSPTPEESTDCLAELLDQPHCVASSRCMEIMSPKSESHGYHLTHKLLYFMVMKNRNCFQLMAPDALPPPTTVYALCALILAERNLIIEMNMPNALKDLFIEQTLLCGLNGFMVFLDDRAISDILSWQRSDIGCYEYYDGALDDTRNDLRHKRSVNILKGNCSDHMTGLAMAAFALFAKTATTGQIALN